MKVFFAGSFNPFTEGHADIVERLAALGYEVIVGIGRNIEKQNSRAKAEENADAIRYFIKEKGLEGRAEVVIYDGLTAREAKRLGADCLARGVRNIIDFTSEYELAAVNRKFFDIETILLPARPELSYISSTVMRDLNSRREGEKENK